MIMMKNNMFMIYNMIETLKQIHRFCDAWIVNMNLERPRSFFHHFLYSRQLLYFFQDLKNNTFFQRIFHNGNHKSK